MSLRDERFKIYWRLDYGRTLLSPGLASVMHVCSDTSITLITVPPLSRQGLSNGVDVS